MICVIKYKSLSISKKKKLQILIEASLSRFKNVIYSLSAFLIRSKASFNTSSLVA